MLIHEVWETRKSIVPNLNLQKAEQMRLQRRKLLIDTFGIAERDNCEQIDPMRFGGLLVKNLCLYHDNHFLLKDITFSVAPGEVVAIFGKTTGLISRIIQIYMWRYLMMGCLLMNEFWYLIMCSFYVDFRIWSK